MTPATATLAVNACMQIGVDFVPQKVGDHAAELVIHYDTGEYFLSKKEPFTVL